MPTRVPAQSAVSTSSEDSDDGNASVKKKLPIAGQALDIDAELKKFEDEERKRLGIAVEQQWVEDMANLMFTKSEKGKITLLIGGLTIAHDYLISGAFSSLGYNTIPLDPPNYDALSVGK